MGVLVMANYGAGEMAMALSDGSFVIHGCGSSAPLTRGQVEAIADRERPRLADGWPVHDPAGGRADARIVLARRILFAADSLAATGQAS